MKSTRQDMIESKNDTALNVETLDMNGIRYRLPQALSSAVSRSYKKEFAPASSYIGGTTIPFTLNTGTDYVDPLTAKLSLRFALNVEAPGADVTYRWCGSMGVASLFDEIRIISKNGTELYRCQDSDSLSTILANYSLSSDTFASDVQLAQGYGDGEYENTVLTAGTTFDGLGYLQCVIPLKNMCGFFNPTVKNMLIPSGIASGLRIEFKLKSDISKIMYEPVVGNVPSAFTVTNPCLLLETTALNDPTQSVLMRESSQNGLEYTFPSYHSSGVPLTASSTISQQINKACSQATRVFFVAQRAYEAKVADEMVLDTLQSIASSSFTSNQWKVGNWYFPSQSVDSSAENYGYALSATKGWSFRNGVSLDLDDYNRKSQILAASLETTDRLNLSGLMLNNSNQAELRLTVGTISYYDNASPPALVSPNNTARGILFIEYIAVARCSLNQTQLRS